MDGTTAVVISLASLECTLLSYGSSGIFYGLGLTTDTHVLDLMQATNTEGFNVNEIQEDMSMGSLQRFVGASPSLVAGRNANASSYLSPWI